MKLTDIETFVVGNPPPHFGGRYFVFVKITTDTGVSRMFSRVMRQAMIRIISKISGGGFIQAALLSIRT
jgi:hypothetical protein